MLKQQLKKEGNEEIKNTTTSSETAAKEFLQQRKFKSLLP